MGAEFPVRAVLDDRGIDQLITALTKVARTAGVSEKEIKEMNDELKRTSRDGVKNVNDVNSSFDNLAKKGIRAAREEFLKFIAVQQLLNLGKKIIEVTSEFQRLQAVLKTTLGSESAANQAFKRIQEFASKTPFQVREVTDSFVQLANRGFVPTNEELRKLGDLAASQGKSFKQLTEAVLDAQTLEFERLKEFGIKARQTNDSVIFSFKGVQTQVDKNDDAIRDYILSLGDLQGVSGGMEEISKTLGGALSNAADSTDRLFNALGNLNDGPLKYVINLFTDLTGRLAELIELANKDPFKEIYGAETQKAIEEFNRLTKEDQADAINEVVGQVQRWRKEVDLLLDADKALQRGGVAEAAKVLGLSIEDTNDVLNNYNFELENTKAILADYEDRYNQFLLIYNKGTGEIEYQSEALKRQQEHLKEHAKLMEKLAETVSKINDEIKLSLTSFHANVEEVQDAFRGHDKRFIALEQLVQKSIKDTIELLEEEKELPTQMSEAEYKAMQDRVNARKKAVEEMKQLETDLLLFSFDVAAQLIDLGNEQLAVDIQNLQVKKEREIAAAGENAEAKKRINGKYDEEEKRLKKKQAERARSSAVFNILLNTAQGITAALASVPPNVPLSIFVGITGAIQAGLAAAKPIPQFKDGVYNMNGKGTATSDSNLAWLSKGEDVVPANRNNKWGFLLKPIIENDNFQLKDAKRLIEDYVPPQFRGDLFTVAKKESKSDRIERKLDEINKTIKGKKETHINIDEDGFQKWALQGAQWTNYANKRYSA